MTVIIKFLNAVGQILLTILPDSTFLPLPSGVTSAFSWLGSVAGTAAAIMPDNFFSNIAAALTFVVAVNTFVIPWLAARNFKLPFTGIFGRK